MTQSLWETISFDDKRLRGSRAGSAMHAASYHSVTFFQDSNGSKRTEMDQPRLKSLGIVVKALIYLRGSSACHAGGREFESRRSRHITA